VAKEVVEEEMDLNFIRHKITEDLKTHLKTIPSIFHSNSRIRRQIGHKVLAREVGEDPPAISEVSHLEEVQEAASHPEEVQEVTKTTKVVSHPEEDQEEAEVSLQEVEEDRVVDVEIAAIIQIAAAVIFIHLW